jgi:ketol-acid reductoisomerase
MKKILNEIQNGSFTKEFINNVGDLPARREFQRNHQIEKVARVYAHDALDCKE